MDTKRIFEKSRVVNFKTMNCEMFLQNIIYVSFFMCLLGVVRAQKDISLLSKEELKDIASQLRNIEGHLVSIEVDSEVWMEERLGKSDPWERTPIYISSTAVLSGLRSKKSRVDVHKEVEWGEGEKPHAVSYSAGFDGQYGKTIYHGFSTDGGTRAINNGEITPDIPSRLRSGSLRCFTGQAFSMHYCLNPQGYTFSQLFGWATDPNTKADSSFSFSIDSFYGIDCIKISTGEGVGESWWLDPNRGYSLVGHTLAGYYEDGTKRVISFARVTILGEDKSSGIWWPKEVIVEADPDEPGEPYKRMTYKATAVRVNRRGFNEGIYTITFPKGCIVDDKVRSIKYEVGKQS